MNDQRLLCNNGNAKYLWQMGNEAKEKKVRTDLLEFTAMMNAKEGEKTYCKKFGCGRVLNPTESLLGDFCYKHQVEYNQQQRQNAKSSLHENNGFPL